MSFQMPRQGSMALAELKRRFGEDWLDWAERWGASQTKILTSQKQYLFAFGGNGAGKTQLGGYWAKIQLDSFNPLTGEVIERQHPVTMYCAAPTLEKVEGVMKPSLRQWFPKGVILKETSAAKGDVWHLTEGRRVMWKTGKQDPMTWTGDEIDAAWVDEELASEEHWKRMLSRGFRRLARYLTTMTAENGTLWLHNWVFSPDEYPMEEKDIVQIDTRENPYYSDCDNCSKPKRWHGDSIHKTCAKFSNVKGQMKIQLRIRQCSNPYDFEVRIKGSYLLSTGRSVIEPGMREKLKAQHQSEPLVGYLSEELRFVKLEGAQARSDCGGWLRIATKKVSDETGQNRRYALMPRPGHTYVVGVDAAEGNPTGDYHSAVVIDYETGEQVALAHTRSMPARDFGACVVQLCTFYNQAFLVIEANNHGGSVIDQAIALGYGNLYKRDRFDAVARKPMPRIGFFTDGKSKKPAVDLMATYVCSRMKIHDPIIYGEMFHYMWLADQRPGSHGVGNSNPKGHDDTMTALFCASVGLRKLGWSVVSPEEAPQKHYEKTLGDELMEDATGRTMTEEEAIEALQRGEEEQQQIGDVYIDGDGTGMWVP